MASGSVCGGYTIASIRTLYPGSSLIKHSTSAVLTVLFISPFLNIDGDSLLQYEYRMFFWLGLPIPNLACWFYFDWWPGLLVGLLLLTVFVAQFIAYSRCQPVILSRLIGGDGHEGMVLYVSERGDWRDMWALTSFARDRTRVRL